MQFLKRIAILLPICLNISYAFAQPIQFSFQNFSEKDGLSDNNIHSFYQDSRGYLWICTNEGLNRFDGYTFKKFYTSNNQKSLPSNIVYNVLENKPGQLLVATSNGLTKFNMLTNTFEAVADTMISTKFTNYIFKEKNGDIILCYNDGIAFLDSLLDINNYLKTTMQVMGVHRLKSGELVAATVKGYYFIDKEKGSLKPLINSFDEPVFPQAIIFSYYDSIYNLLYTSVWNKGLFVIDLTKKKVERYNAFSGCEKCLSTNMIYCAFRDSRQKIWVGSNKGIFMLDKINEKHNLIQHRPGEPYSLIDNMVLKIYEDGNKNLWFATPGGISRLNQKDQSIRQYKDEFIIKGNPADINDITRGNDNKLYISTYGNGIFCLDEETKSVKNIGRDLIPFNWSVTNAGDSIIATGHNRKMYSYHPVIKKIMPLDFLNPFYGKSNLLLFSFTHSNGDKWYSINEGGGLVLYSEKEKKYFHYTNKDIPKPFSENYFSMAAEDKDKNIWFAVNRSTHLVCWVYKTRQFITVDFKQARKKMPNNFAGITDLLINGKEIWVATSGAGIVLYLPLSNSVSIFSINDGLAGDVVNSLMMDNKKRLWAGTAKGLSCLQPGQNFFSSFSAANGLPETDFNERSRFYDPDKDKLYLGSQNSLLVITPGDLLENKSLNIRAHLDGIKVNGENINYHENKNIFKYDQNNFQFNFSVVDLISSSGINLLYRLTGADNDWINAGDQRTASYINLPAGKYQLQLKITIPGSNFSSSHMPFSFTIQQAWWKTSWFYIVLAVSGIMVLYLIVRMYYLRKLEHQQMVFQKKQAVEHERSRIATDMHDDLGAGLTGIKFLSENIMEHNISADANERLEKLKGSANKLIESMGEIIWAMNEKNNTIEDLLFHLRSYSHTYSEENGLTCDFKLPENIEEQVISGHTRRNIFLIIKECLHNIVKHANAKKVEIKIYIKKDLLFEIQDDGSGFHPNEAVGNGLINMRKRAKEMNGSFSIANKNGTFVRFTIPISE